MYTYGRIRTCIKTLKIWKSVCRNFKNACLQICFTINIILLTFIWTVQCIFIWARLSSSFLFSELSQPPQKIYSLRCELSQPSQGSIAKVKASFAGESRQVPREHRNVMKRSLDLNNFKHEHKVPLRNLVTVEVCRLF